VKAMGKIDSVLVNMVPDYGYPSKYEQNAAIKLKATWLPVSFWNFGIVLSFLALFTGLTYLIKRIFEGSKWSNSSNSPYPTN
jgi:hypothetical protein